MKQTNSDFSSSWNRNKFFEESLACLLKKSCKARFIRLALHSVFLLNTPEPNLQTSQLYRKLFSFDFSEDLCAIKIPFRGCNKTRKRWIAEPFKPQCIFESITIINFSSMNSNYYIWQLFYCVIKYKRVLIMEFNSENCLISIDNEGNLKNLNKGLICYSLLKMIRKSIKTGLWSTP